MLKNNRRRSHGIPSCLYLFPVAAVTTYHRMSVIKQHKFTLLQLWRKLHSKPKLHSKAACSLIPLILDRLALKPVSADEKVGAGFPSASCVPQTLGSRRRVTEISSLFPTLKLSSLDSYEVFSGFL